MLPDSDSPDPARRVVELPVREINSLTDSRDILRHATKQAADRGFSDYTIVDIDSHHTETESWSEILEYVDDDVLKQIGQSFNSNTALLGYAPGIRYQDLSGRIPHQTKLAEKVDDVSVHRDVTLSRRSMEGMSLDYQVMFPSPMLLIPQHPQPDVATSLTLAYNRWLTRRILPSDKRIKSMIALPMNDPDACVETIDEFDQCDGVIGYMIMSTYVKPVHHNAYMKVFSRLEKTGKPLGFHAGHNWGDGGISTTNRFIGMHALSFVTCNMVHMTNYVLNGLPERFPDLKVIWIESGLAWVPFLMQRLDNEYLMRSSEAPLLRKRPSEYMREMYYTNQPMEATDLDLLQSTFKAIHAETQLLYSSDWPHWDFDLPSVIFDLPFLSEQAKRNILGETACRIFNLELKKDTIARSRA